MIRLFYNGKIEKIGQLMELDDKQSHYLCNVMRLQNNDCFAVFDGKSGEFEAQIIKCDKKKAQAVITKKMREMQASPDVWLLFAPLKKDKTDMVVQKATELGVAKIIPVITEYTNAEKVRTERFVTQSIEASEQCRRLDVPQICEAVGLSKILDGWDDTRVLFFMNEKGNPANIIDVMKNCKKSAILVGPEGGFSEKEREKLLALPFVKNIFLGQRILRAETAVISALACWQATNGDW